MMYLHQVEFFRKIYFFQKKKVFDPHDVYH
jgi:hypothetical protein